MPDYEVENLARSFLPAMEKFFASDEGIAANEKWLSEQEDTTDEVAISTMHTPTAGYIPPMRYTDGFLFCCRDGLV